LLFVIEFRWQIDVGLPMNPHTAFTAMASTLKRRLPLLFALIFLLAACRPSPQANVFGYLVERQFGLLATPAGAPGSIAGRVVRDGAPVATATVLVAERTGAAHTARTDAAGRYRIDAPPGRYVLTGVAPGLAEGELTTPAGAPILLTLEPGTAITVADLTLQPLTPPLLPADLAAAVNLRQTAAYTASAPFPTDAAAQVRAYAFDHNGVTVDSLRLYLPLDATPADRYPPVLFIAPTAIDDWQHVSVAFAANGYAVVGIAPEPERGVDADAQAGDALIALRLAQSGALGPEVGAARPVAMGGSYSSAILARLLRLEGNNLAGWVTVGGLADAFAGAQAYYAGEIEMPPQYNLLVPALGPPNRAPLAFLRYSPVFVADELPATLIIHTAADRVLPIDQAYALEAAVRGAGVPVETYYYEDVSHYLGIGENLTDSGREMFYRILAFLQRYGGSE
jgi:acetyl esterase/lipase